MCISGWLYGLSTSAAQWAACTNSSAQESSDIEPSTSSVKMCSQRIQCHADKQKIAISDESPSQSGL